MIDLFQEIYTTVRQNKLRTALTGFAVAWGIFILIFLLGAGNGILNAFKKSSSQFNANSISIQAGWTSVATQGFQRGRSIKFKEEDIELLSDELKEYLYNGSGEIRISSPYSTLKDFVEGNVYGVYPSFQDNEVVQLIRGRFINEKDGVEKRKVVVIHEDNVPILFGTDEVIGNQLIINESLFTVIGVYKGSDFKDSRDVYVPLQTLKTIYNKDEVTTITFLLNDIKSKEESEALEKEIKTVLAKKHKFDPNDWSAAWIWNRLMSYLQMQKAENVINTAIWIIGIFTLLSGIVGVSNIMLITVKERTREFGIRKAIGASPFSILRLVVVESIIITTFFGYLGMFAGIAATEWLDRTMGEKIMDAGAFSRTVFLDPSVDIKIAIQATLTLIIAGTIAGFVPARRAVRIKPIEALNAR